MTQREKIEIEAWAKFEAWLERWREDLYDLDIYERATVYGHMGAGIDIDAAKAMARLDCQRLL